MNMKYSLTGLHLTEQFEGIYRASYPDPASPLAKLLQNQGRLAKILGDARNGIPYLPQLGDPSGAPWTIGYGHTGAEVVPGMVWTAAQCEDGLARDIASAEAHVNRVVTREDLRQGEFNALVDFTFNCGMRNLDNSSLLRLVNAGDDAHAANEFEKWDNAGGHVVAGLLRRRQAEKTEFQS